MKEKANLTQEEKNELIMLKLRNYIDSKNFYKSSDY